jgi:hypothetical protein
MRTSHFLYVGAALLLTGFSCPSHANNGTSIIATPVEGIAMDLWRKAYDPL